MGMIMHTGSTAKETGITDLTDTAETESTGGTGGTGSIETTAGTDSQPASRPADKAQSLVFIDDNALVLKSIRKLLDNSAYELLFCEDVYSGLCQVNASRPMAVFIDADMQKLSGLEFCAILKHNPGFRYIRIILIMQEADMCLQAKALAAGANAVLNKPFGRNELLAIIDRPGRLAA